MTTVKVHNVVECFVLFLIQKRNTGDLPRLYKNGKLRARAYYNTIVPSFGWSWLVRERCQKIVIEHEASLWAEAKHERGMVRVEAKSHPMLHSASYSYVAKHSPHFKSFTKSFPPSNFLCFEMFNCFQLFGHGLEVFKLVYVTVPYFSFTMWSSFWPLIWMFPLLELYQFGSSSLLFIIDVNSLFYLIRYDDIFSKLRCCEQLC